ncbi:odorant receptor 4 [Diachasma alloeum]|uniref:Odorant receptor n=1 Tax=Diachasma alloeum TaxID=454923 RepID=A0A4E0RM27_9HYME|nr:odorant receptor 4 [Diachasma alloeum]THK33189.1 odorant receptor 101 [Diachasma alloeum]
MDFHKETFLILTYMGLWKPKNLSKWKSIFYNLYSAVVVTMMTTYGLSRLVNMIVSTKNMAQFIFLGVLESGLKGCTLFFYASKIINIFEMVSRPPFQCQTSEESLVHQQFSREVRRVSRYCFMYIMIAAPYYGIDAFFTALPKRKLPLECWLPYDYSSLYAWGFSSVCLLLGMLWGITFNVVCNCLFFEMMMQVVLHVKILKIRLRAMINTQPNANRTNNHCRGNQLLLERQSLHHCVQYHIAIIRLGKDIKAILSTIILIKYSLTSIMLCTTVYLMAKTPVFSTNFVSFSVYFGFIFYQIYILCYAGHRIRMEFDSIGEVLYTSNWIALSETSKQSMKFMMINAEKPFVFTCGGILKLDIEALKNTLQLAYSIYNIL